MYYYNSKPTELEKALMEFMQTGKNKGSAARDVQKAPPRRETSKEKIITPDIGKGWPYYKGYAASLQSLEEVEPSGMHGEAAATILNYMPISMPPAPASAPAPALPPPTFPAPVPAHPAAPPDFPNPIGYSGPERHAQKEYELDYAHHLMSDISASLMPHVIEAVNEQEFSGSPIFEGYLYRERLHQMVEDALRRAQAANTDVAAIMRSSCECQSWQRRQLLRAVVESLLIGELFFRRRPIYRKLIDNGWNPGGI